jgi:hypothetical protein
MTEKLKSLLHEQAETVDFAVPDVAALTRAGDRRVRRRRALVGGVAALAVAGALAATRIAGGPAAESTPVVSDPVPQPAQVTWATGHVLHVGDRTIDVEVGVKAFVRTSAGFVVADPGGVVHSVVDGKVSVVGRTDAKHPHLVSDPADTLAGWVELDDDRPGFVVLDQTTGDTTRNDDATQPGMGLLADEQDPAYFYAISGGEAYWRDLRGAVEVDLATGDARVVDAAAANGFDILDVEDGVIAFNAADDGTALGPTRRDAVMLPKVDGSMGTLSPGADYYSSDADEPQVYDARTGEQVALDLRYAFATGYEWLDGHRLAVLAQKTGRSPVQLLTCVVPAGTCDVSVNDLGSFDDLIGRGFQLPVGENLDGG